MVPTCTLPAMISIIPCDAPEVMICCTLMPALRAKYSIIRCPSVPTPGET